MRRVQQELIDAVRRCAEAGLSAGQAGNELGITRNAVIGLANRRGIKFHGAPSSGRPKAKPAPRPGPRLNANVAKMVEPNQPSAFGYVTVPKTKPKPSFRCAWLGCTCETTPGQMFCFPHSKKPLFGPVVSCG